MKRNIPVERTRKPLTINTFPFCCNCLFVEILHFAWKGNSFDFPILKLDLLLDDLVAKKVRIVKTWLSSPNLFKNARKGNSWTFYDPVFAEFVQKCKKRQTVGILTQKKKINCRLSNCLFFGPGYIYLIVHFSLARIDSAIDTSLLAMVAIIHRLI